MAEQSAQTAPLKVISGIWNQKSGNCFCVFALHTQVPTPCSLKQPENLLNLCKTQRVNEKAVYEAYDKPSPYTPNPPVWHI